MPPARRFRDDVEVKSFPRRAVAVPSVPSALSFFFCLLRRRRRHRHVQSTLSLSLSLSNTRAKAALLRASLESASLVLLLVVVFPLASVRRARRVLEVVVSFKEEQKVIYNSSSENPKPYTPIFRVLNRTKSFFSSFPVNKKGRHTDEGRPVVVHPPARAHH